MTKSQAKALLDLDLIVADAADVLTAEGMRELAFKYLDFIGNPKQPNVAYSRDRIYNSDSTK